jgi:hypothetical protein
MTPAELSEQENKAFHCHYRVIIKPKLPRLGRGEIPEGSPRAICIASSTSQEEEHVKDPRKLPPWLGSFRHVSSREGGELAPPTRC